MPLGPARMLIAWVAALLIVSDALAQDAGSVIIYRQQASHWNIVRIPANARAAMQHFLEPGVVDMVEWSAFSSAPQHYLAPLVIRNEYPGTDLPRLIVDLLQTSGGPIAVTWTGGIGISNDDRDYAEKIYRLFRDKPQEYERTKLSADRARDPLYPERSHVRSLAGRPEPKPPGPWWKWTGDAIAEAPAATEEQAGRLAEFASNRFSPKGLGQTFSRSRLIEWYGRPGRVSAMKVRRDPQDPDDKTMMIVTTWEYHGLTIVTRAEESSPDALTIARGEVTDARVSLSHGVAVGQPIEQWERQFGRPQCGSRRLAYESSGNYEIGLEIDGLGRVFRVTWSVWEG